MLCRVTSKKNINVVTLPSVKRAWDGETEFENVCNVVFTVITGDCAVNNKDVALCPTFLGMSAISASVVG